MRRRAQRPGCRRRPGRRAPDRRAPALLHDTSGQAMAEYAVVVASITGALVAASFTFLPDFIKALQEYYDGFYIMLNLPIP